MLSSKQIAPSWSIFSPKLFQTSFGLANSAGARREREIAEEEEELAEEGVALAPLYASKTFLQSSAFFTSSMFCPVAVCFLKYEFLTLG